MFHVTVFFDSLSLSSLISLISFSSSFSIFSESKIKDKIIDILARVRSFKLYSGIGAFNHVYRATRKCSIKLTASANALFSLLLNEWVGESLNSDYLPINENKEENTVARSIKRILTEKSCHQKGQFESLTQITSCKFRFAKLSVSLNVVKVYSQKIAHFCLKNLKKKRN